MLKKNYFCGGFVVWEILRRERMRLTNLFRSLAVGLALFTISANAATVAIAHIIYEGDSLYYADNEEKLKYSLVSQERDGTYTIKFNEERLDNGKAELRRLRFGLNCEKNTDKCGTYLTSEEKDMPYLATLFPEYDQTIKDQPVYEVWLKLSQGSLEILPGIPDEYVVPDSATVIIRLLPSWNNTTALMTLNGKDYSMTPIRETYCGWFEDTLRIVPKNVYVSFKQTIGDMYIGKNGPIKEPIDIEDEIKLDSALAIGKELWIVANQYGEPEISTAFPEILGDCPVKKLPVMMFDWLHGDQGDEKNAIAQAGTTSQDFGTGGCKGEDNAYKARLGMVERELGPNGVPVRAKNFPKECEITDHLDYWFLPEVLATDAAGNQYTNATCRDLELTLDNKGFWLGQKNLESPEKGLFFLDDFKFLDEAGTVPNPNFDWINGGENIGTHNYGFTMKIQAQFEYVRGQYFEFYGDDDVWVFINNKLVVDIGGQHHQVSGSVKLDTIGQDTGDPLIPGETYPFHIFYAERHKDESNFKMRTSIDLKTDASMFLKDIPGGEKVIQKEVWQIVRKTALACDFSTSPELRDTTLGPSTFTLFGKSLAKGGIALSKLDSAYYSGIKVTNDYTMLTIDLQAIGFAQSLPPGTYYVRVALRDSPDQYKDVYFTVDPYELPNLAYASVKDSSYCVANISETADSTVDSTCYTQYWHAFGNEISRDVSSDTLPVNLDRTERMWAGRSYPVNIMYAEEWATIYSGIAVSIISTNPNLIACDSLGNIIDEVVLVAGHASFYIKAQDEVINATLTIKSAGAKNASVDWTNINIAVPPVPQIDSAFIYDRNGDGRADSIWLHFNKALGGQSVLDSLKFVFGSNFDTPYKAVYNDGEDFAYVVASGSGFSTSIYTGGAMAPYNGKITVYYTYTDESGKQSYFPVEGILYDRVGPVIVAAEIEYMSDGNTFLRLSFSEGVNEENANIDLFSFHCWKDKVLHTVVKTPGRIGAGQPNQWSLVFSKGSTQDIVPAVGDSIRFTVPSMGGQAHDLIGILPHEGNPWVRITGEQKVTVTSPKVVALDPAAENFESAKEIITNPNATVPKLVVSEQAMSAEQVAAVYGTQGHYLGDLDMAQLVENEIAEIVKAVQSTPSYVDKKAANDPANADKTYTIDEIIAAVANGTMSIGEAKDRFDLSEVIVDAYENGLLNVENLHYYSSGTEADIKNIVSTVAESTVLTYKTFYYTSLGHYVSGQTGRLTCNDDIFKDGGRKNCLDSDGKLFLAWNMRADNGRLAATGVYIARLEIKIKVNTKTITDKTQDFLWGVRRGQVNAIDLGL